MQYKNSINRISILTNILFTIFSFTYIFFYQKDILYAFHISLARTGNVYSSLGNAFVITIVLLLIRWGLNELTNLKGIVSALSFFPAFLLLGFLTDFDESLFNNVGLNRIWIWLLPVSILAYLIIGYSFRKLFCLWIEKERDYKIVLNTNISIIFAFSIMTLLIGNTNKDFHELVKIERAIINDNFNLAEKIGDNAVTTNRPFTVLRTFALAQNGDMGEKLFEYPQKYGADGLFLDNSLKTTQKINNDSISKFIGIANKLDKRLFASLYKIGEKNKKAADYYMAYLLLSKELYKFSEFLPIYNNTSIDSLPKHYKEAVLLESYLQKKDMPKMNNNEMTNEFKDFISKEKNSKQPLLDKKENYLKYRDTYWWYYFNL